MATGGLYGYNPIGALVAAPGAESSGLYGNSTNFGGTYFEWFIFKESATQPSTPTGGVWDFVANTGTAPTGWTVAPPSNPTNYVWISIAIVNSRDPNAYTWSTPGRWYVTGLAVLSGAGVPTGGVDNQYYIQTDLTPQAIWFKESGTWVKLTGSSIYADLTSNQTIAGVKTFSSTIQGNVSGNAGTVTNGVYTDGSYVNPAWIASLAGSKITGDIAGNSTNVTGTVAIVNGGTGATIASGARTNLGLGTIATQDASNVAITGGNESGVTHSNDTIGTYLNYTPNAAPTYSEGRTWYDSTAKTLAYYNDVLGVSIHVGHDLQFKVINNTGSTIANGSPVYITGTSSGQTYPNVALAKADVAATATVIGLTDGAIANGATGYVTSIGNIDNVNTGTFTVGQVLYLSPYSAGQLMNTIPPTGITVQVGMVTFVNSSTGKIYVKQTTPLSVPASIVSGQVAIANGGTGATTAAGALTNLGAYPASNPSGYTSNTGTVTSVNGTGTVNGLSLSGTVTTSGNLTLGGTLDLSSPPAIGGTAANTGAFTTVTSTIATGTAPFTVASTTPVANLSIGGNAGTVTNGVYTTDTGTVTNTMLAGSITNAKLVNSSITFGSTAQALGSTVTALSGVSIDNGAIGATTASTGTFTTVTATTVNIAAAAANAGLTLLRDTGAATRSSRIFLDASGGVTSIYNSANSILFNTSATIGSSSGTQQFAVSHTASAVNYVQVTGAATGGNPSIVSAGSDGAIGLALSSKLTSSIFFYTNNLSANSRHLDITHTGTVVNRFQLTGAQTGFGVTLGVNGSDTNISQVFQSKGTGAIDLAAGSSGVNISNGGTVTAITGTATGTLYTSIPTVNITAPTTAGGVQAVITAQMQLLVATIAGGGTGYTANDTLTLVGGTGTAATLTVSTVSSGVITAVALASGGTYSALPTNPISVTGGTGSGATFTATSYGVRTTAYTVTNAGSGYVEQPTVTFSGGGGGSGAAAYATVGSGTTIKSIGATLDLSVDNTSSQAFRFYNSGGTGTAYWSAASGSTSPFLYAQGGTNVTGRITSNGTGALALYTGGGAQLQFNVAHTASAVNYVQVTGAATGAAPTISAQGSDANPNIAIFPKGLGIVLLNQQTPTAVTATGTLTIANLLTQIITSTSATAVSLTLPTGTLSDAGVSGGTSAVNTSFNWSIINTGSAVGDVTLVAGTAHTIVGSATVAVGTSGSFRSRKTATNTFVTYRV